MRDLRESRFMISLCSCFLGSLSSKELLDSTSRPTVPVQAFMSAGQGLLLHHFERLEQSIQLEIDQTVLVKTEPIITFALIKRVELNNSPRSLTRRRTWCHCDPFHRTTAILEVIPGPEKAYPLLHPIHAMFVLVQHDTNTRRTC